MSDTPLTASEAIRLHSLLVAEVQATTLKVSRPGKRPSAEEKARLCAIRDRAEERLDAFLDLVDPEHRERGKRPFLEVNAEEEAILARLGI